MEIQNYKINNLLAVSASTVVMAVPTAHIPLRSENQIIAVDVARDMIAASYPWNRQGYVSIRGVPMICVVDQKTRRLAAILCSRLVKAARWQLYR